MLYAPMWLNVWDGERLGCLIDGEMGKYSRACVIAVGVLGLTLLLFMSHSCFISDFVSSSILASLWKWVLTYS